VRGPGQEAKHNSCEAARAANKNKTKTSYKESSNRFWLTKPRQATMLWHQRPGSVARNCGNQRSTTFNRCQTPVSKSGLWLAQLHYYQPYV